MRGPVLAPPRGWFPTDLTVVVVFYNMKREAARTLHTMSRAYQQGIDDITYDVFRTDIDDGYLAEGITAETLTIPLRDLTGLNDENREICVAIDATLDGAPSSTQDTKPRGDCTTIKGEIPAPKPATN